MKENIVVLKLNDETLDLLRGKVMRGEATEIEKLVYYSTYSMGQNDKCDPVEAWL